MYNNCINPAQQTNFFSGRKKPFLRNIKVCILCIAKIGTKYQCIGANPAPYPKLSNILIPESWTDEGAALVTHGHTCFNPPRTEARFCRLARSSFMEKDKSMSRYRSMGKLLAGRTSRLNIWGCWGRTRRVTDRGETWTVPSNATYRNPTDTRQKRANKSKHWPC